jgi:hypothetical protein
MIPERCFSVEDVPLSRGERVGVRGYGVSEV